MGGENTGIDKMVAGKMGMQDREVAGARGSG